MFCAEEKGSRPVKTEQKKKRPTKDNHFLFLQ